MGALTAVSWFAGAILLAGGCAHAVEVPVSHLPRLAALGDGRAVIVRVDGERVALARAADVSVQVTLRRSCSFLELLARSCDRERDVPAASLRAAEGGRAVVVGGERLALGAIERATIEVDGLVPRGFRARWALGFTIAGPAAAAGIALQWFPAEPVALEVGALPGADAGVLWTGARIRPVRVGLVRPWLGASATVIAAFDPATARRYVQPFGAARLGLDVELGMRRLLVSLELDLVVLTRPEEGFVYDVEGPYRAWGGGTVAYQL